MLNAMRQFIRSFLWIVPFVSFLAGYQLLRFLSHTEVVDVPNIVGFRMSDAIKTLSSIQLNARILAEKEDPEAQEGIIISQTPHSGQKVKPHQSIFLVITRRPPKPRAPSLFGLHQQEALAKAKEAGVTLKLLPLESQYPTGTIIAQNTQPQQEVTEKTISAYITTGSSSLRLMPDLKERSVEEVKKFFAPFGIAVEVKHPEVELDHVCKTCIVIEQRPLSGSPIDLKQPSVVTITTTEKS